MNRRLTAYWQNIIKEKKTPVANKNFVVNLSNHTLSENQFRVLNKGLKFAFTSDKLPILDLIMSVESGIQKMIR